MANIESQKGISLLFVVMIMAIILGIGMGVSSILSQQMKMLSETVFSVSSFYSADSGIEQELYDLYKLTEHNSSYTGTVGPASYTVSVSCSPSNGSCFAGFPVDETCTSANFCMKSIGEYREIKRAIEAKY